MLMVHSARKARWWTKKGITGLLEAVRCPGRDRHATPASGSLSMSWYCQVA